MYRSFLTFPITALRGLNVESASVSLYEFYSWSCTATPFYVYLANGTTSSTNWNTQTAGIKQIGSLSTAKGYSSGCAGTRVSVPITAQAQSWSTVTTYNNSAIRLSASETDNYGWKKFYSLESSQDPYVTYTYNRKPNASPAPAVSNEGTYNGVGYTSVLQPTVSSVATDPDGNSYQTTTEVSLSSDSSATTVASCVSPWTASGASASCQLGAGLADNQEYRARTAVQDDQGAWNGTWSPWTTLRTSTVNPAAPAISCPGYADGSWTDSAPSAAVSCTVSVSQSGYDASVEVFITVDGVAQPMLYPAQAPGSATVSVSNTAGEHSVQSQAVSASGLQSAMASTTFGYGGASLSAPRSGASSAAPFAVSAAGPPMGSASSVTAKLQWRASGSTAWTDGPNLTVPQPSGSSVSATGIWDSSVNGTSGTRPALMDIQVCFTYSGGSTARAPSCTWADGTPTSVTRLPHAFGHGYPTAPAGPGTVALSTGEFSTAATDAKVSSYNGELSVTRSHMDLTGDGTPAGWGSDAVSGIFGPGWTADLGLSAGAAGDQVDDSTSVDGTISLVSSDGSALTWQQPTTAGDPWTAVTDDTKADGSSLTLTGTGTSRVLTYTQADGTVTTFVPNGTTGTDTAWAPWSVTPPGSGKVRYHVNTSSHVDRVLGAVPAGSTCPVDPAVPLTAPGCKSLDLTYGTTNGGGDWTGQVKTITENLWDGTTASGHMSSTVVAQYSYDSTGRLVQVTDPTTGLVTAYTWDGTSTRLASLTPPGLASYHFTYSASPSRLTQVTRDDPNGGSTPATLAQYAYDITLTAAGLPDLSGVQTRWGQQTAPTHGYAVFGADHPVNLSAIGSGDWPYADVQYTDDDGQTLNTASYGSGAWQVTSSDYDSTGHRDVVRQLDARATAQASDPSSADALATTTVYDSSGLYVTDVYGPQHPVLISGANTTQVLRTHTHTTYDQGAPNSDVNPTTKQPYHLPTTVVVAVSDATNTDKSTYSTTTTGYDPITTGDASGWALGQPTKVTVAGVSRVTRYDAQGRVIESRQPMSTGTDAGTTVTSYYEAGAAAPCGEVQWAGLVCQTSHVNASGVLPATTVSGYSRWGTPVTTTETSGSDSRTTTVAYDTAGRAIGSAVTTTLPGPGVPATYTKYDTVTGLVDYTGVANNANVALATDATATRVSTGYDKWGRTVSYTNQSGDTTTTSYDSAGRVSQVNAGVGGTTTYGYDGTDSKGRAEHRGLPTRISVSTTGTATADATASYDENGALVEQALPDNLTQDLTYDSAGQLSQLTYTGQVTTTSGGVTTTGNAVWLAWSQRHDGAGRVAQEWTPQGAAFTPPNAGDPAVGAAAGYDRAYGYDELGRLTTVQDRSTAPAGGTVDPSTDASLACQTRTYGYDANSNRLTRTVTPAAADGSCSTTTTTAASKSWAYNTADQAVTASDGAGYTYDTFGRQTSMPAGDAPDPSQGAISLGYFSTDQPASVTQGGTSTTYTMDVTDRRVAAGTGPTGQPATSTVTRHYVDGSDNPGWLDTNGAITRYATTFGASLGLQLDASGAVTLDLANPHGDVVTTATAPANGACTAINGWSSYDEFGAPTTTTIAQAGTADAAGYGWLGAKQRSTTTASAGLTLMGDRYYNATTGRFTSLDPVPGGNANTYTYPLDPINQSDLNGRWGWGWVSSAWHQAATIVHYHYQHAVIGFSICSYACGSVEFQGGHVSLGWGNVGVGLGAYAGWNTQRVHASSRNSYSMSVGGGYAVSGTYTWGSNASHTQHHWGQAEFTGGLGGGLWGGAGYSHTWKIGWGKWSVI